MQFTIPDVIWAGTQQSLLIATEAHNAILAGIFQVGSQPKEDEDEKSYLLTKHGDIGVIAIRGSLTNRDSYWNRYSGVTSYNEIRRALVQATQDASVKAILLDISSGGGSVAGLSDVGNLIRQVSGVKRVVSFTDDNMCSAAYWLGCSADEVYTSKTAVMGSIGVIATHMEYSEMFKKAGIGVNVVRAGEFKALLNSYEKASKEGLEQQGELLMTMYDVFVEHVAECRGTTVAAVNNKMAQGREFVGAMAVDAGLADGITTFDKLIGTMQAKVLDTQDYSFDNSDNPNRTMPMKQTLTEQQIAALQAGAPATAGAAPAAPVAETPAAPAAPVAEAPAAETPAAPAAPVAGTDALVKYLQGQIDTAQASVARLQTELSTANAKVAEMEAPHKALIAIAAGSVKTMKIALGMSAVDMSAMSPQQILAEHAAATEQFQKAFKVGGVAAAPSQTGAETAQVDDANHAARLAATRYTR